MKFGLTPDRGTIDAVLIIRRMQEEQRTKGKKFYMRFVDIENAIERAKNICWNGQLGRKECKKF